MTRSKLAVGLYLGAIVLANLTIVWFGPGISVLNAFLFIGLDLSLRDSLHDSWRGRGLVPKMGLLIIAGGLISYLLNAGAGRIAIASTIAFGAAAIIDVGVYHLLYKRSFMVRVNGSNLPAAAVDSIVFPTLAFGSFLPWIVLGQFAAKVAGGFLWSLVLQRNRPLVGISH